MSNSMQSACAKAVPPTVERLEWVREECGYPNLKAFWKALTADGAYQISYEAARKYHMSRAAPADYLARVADVCGVGLLWLVTGEGKQLVSQQEIDAAFVKLGKLFRDLPGMENFFLTVPKPAYYAVESFLAEVRPSSSEYSGEDSEAWREFVERFGKMFFAPFQSPRHFAQRKDLSDAEMTTYALTLIAALRPLVRALRHGGLMGSSVTEE